MSNKVIKIGKKIYPFPKQHYETDKNYFIRKDFFIKANPQTEDEYIRALTMSLAYSNHITLKCLYPPEVMEKINNVL